MGYFLSLAYVKSTFLENFLVYSRAGNYEISLSAIQKKGYSSLTSFLAAELYDTSVSWTDIDWLKSLTKLPILLKGIITGIYTSSIKCV